MTQLENLVNNLSKANKRLREATKCRPTRMNKDATIQRFEFSFELAWKTVQAYVKDQGLECRSPKSCFRKGAELDLIENPEVWFGYLGARNLIAHVYNQKLADKIYRKALKFPKEIDKLLPKIKGER